MASEYHRGDMDIHEQTATYEAFGVFTKWGSLAVAVGLLMLVLWFCTPAGFLGGFITGRRCMVAAGRLAAARKAGRRNTKSFSPSGGPGRTRDA